MRPLSVPVNRFRFGSQVISTRVFMMAPRALALREPYVDVTAAMDERPRERTVVLRVVPGTQADVPAHSSSDDIEDPFGEVNI